MIRDVNFLDQILWLTIQYRSSDSVERVSSGFSVSRTVEHCRQVVKSSIVIFVISVDNAALIWPRSRTRHANTSIQSSFLNFNAPSSPFSASASVTYSFTLSCKMSNALKRARTTVDDANAVPIANKTRCVDPVDVAAIMRENAQLKLA